MMDYSGSYLIYLRKSRSDEEAEHRGEGETLARHEHTLLALADRLRLHVAGIYREVVSGETIAARPKMQQLLSEVEQGVWAGVLVMEVERLARGDTVDQGIVAQTFKYSGTKIITPAKTYDPDNEFDEEYFEFGLFMSRREYKTINRRLQRGRLASIYEGKYVGSIPPYGYDKVKIEGGRGFTLAPNPDEAPVVRMMYELYTGGEPNGDGALTPLGLCRIAGRLNAMKIPAKHGGNWTASVVRDTLRNPVYIGKLRWEWRKPVKRSENGVVTKTRPRNEGCMIVEGLHPPLVDEDTYHRAIELLKRKDVPAIHEKGVTRNPLCGLIICGKCGKRMQRRPYYQKNHADSLICQYSDCDNVSSDLQLVEARILEALNGWLTGCRVKWERSAAPGDPGLALKQKALKKLDVEIATLEKQRGSLHDLLEQGVYDTDTFLERSRRLAERLEQATRDRKIMDDEITMATRRLEAMQTIVPKVERLLDVYDALPDAAAKNSLLKEVLEQVVYTKTADVRNGGKPDGFQLDIFPILPRMNDPR